MMIEELVIRLTIRTIEGRYGFFAHHFNNDEKGGDRADDNEGYDDDDGDMSESGRCRLEQEGQEPMRLRLMHITIGNWATTTAQTDAKKAKPVLVWALLGQCDNRQLAVAIYI